MSELADVLREALDGSDRQRIDLLAIDACHVQFLELTHELEDVVRLLIAPQTAIPEAGWDYRRVLSRWKTLAASTPPLGAPDVARALLDEIASCYQNDEASWSVSALNLHRLGDVANAFDTLCIGSMQVLGEGLIWRAWELLLRYMDKVLSAPVYDCGSFFTVWAEALETMADEASQSWLLAAVAHAGGPPLDPFFESTARHLETALTATDAGLQADAAARAARARVSQIVAVLRAKDRHKAARRLAHTLEAGQWSRVDLLHQDGSNEARDRARTVARASEQAVRTAMARAERLMPDVSRFDYERTTDASRMATHLARQAGSGSNVAAGQSRR